MQLKLLGIMFIFLRCDQKIFRRLVLSKFEIRIICAHATHYNYHSLKEIMAVALKPFHITPVLTL